MPDLPSAAVAADKAKLFARVEAIHATSAALLRQSGREAAARQAQRAAAFARGRARYSEAVARLLRLAHSTPLDTLLDDALAGGITLLAADLGNLQLLDPATRRLRIAAQRGFGSEFLTHFADVDDASTACGRALRAGVQAVIEDVQADAAFAPHRTVAAASGFRAVQSTPLIDRHGRLHGVLSTHFHAPHRPPERELRVMQAYARQLADSLAARVA